MALIIDEQVNLFALKRILKEFNDLMKDIRVPNYSKAFTFCIDESNIASVAKEIKNTMDNSIDDQVGAFAEVSDPNVVLVDYPITEFDTQAVDSLSNRLTQMSLSSFLPSVSMFETTEFVIFKVQIEDKIRSVLSSSKEVKDNKLSLSVWIDANTDDGHGKQSAMSNKFLLNLQVNLIQL